MDGEDKNTARLPIELLSEMAEALRTLAHADRLRIVEMLEREGEAPVHQITSALGLPQAVVSGHLNRMRRSGLLASGRRGKEIWYRIANPSSLTVLECIRKKARAE